MPSGRTRSLVTAALIAALLSASAYLTIPTQPVPVTLQVFVVLLAALLLGPGWAGAAVGAYLLLGAAGVPVFSGPAGGIGVLVGPRAGYLFGFLAAAVLGSAVRSALARRHRGAADAAACVVAILVVYALGWGVLTAVSGMTPAAAFTAGVVPFLPLDVVKAFAAVAVAAGVRRALPTPGTTAQAMRQA